MNVLIVGASGATGRNLVEQLLGLGQKVKVIVRASSGIPESWNNHEKVTVVRGNINEMSTNEMAQHIKDCRAGASCLGHNLSLKGIYGKPRKLVTDAVNLICDAVVRNGPDDPFKFVLMNTTGNRNRDLIEPISIGEKMVTGLIRVLLPPHPDNEKAADYLRVNIGQNNSFIKWVVVRPDSLTNEDKVTEYTTHPSPIRSALFNPGKTSRINVGEFMARLIVENDEWDKWEGQMPVIYNVDEG